MATLDLSEYVRITNRTGDTIKGMYDGVEYVFKHNEPTDVHNLVAAHIFGFGVENKLNAFHRLGWIRFRESYEDAMKKLDDVEFGEVPSPAIDIASASKLRRSKTSSPTPLADAGVEAGERGNSLSPEEALDLEDVVGGD